MQIKTPLLTALTLVLVRQVGCSAQAETKKERRGPPPEAYTVCEGKSAGEQTQLQTRRGDTVSGTCVDNNGTLVFRPDNPPHGKRQRHHSDNPSSD